MNCFYHPTTVAVGICKSCGKGLCPSCAADLGKGLACKGRCDQQVTALINLIETNIKQVPVYTNMTARAYKNRYIGAFFPFCMGLVFLAFALHSYWQNAFQDIDFFTGALGICLTLFGIILIFQAAAVPRPFKNN